ncbi:sulfur carrier protein ThiS [Opitutia bacterium ISCC 51]|nr:sulfur carrier protein ThiS [Opitutae bacterium ISCC 51]QXD29478.1 sulfur carrier protein ThiS [Opitutae bacterium ISCC 52]
MTITVNDEIQSLEDISSLHDLLQSMALVEKTGIAVAVNESVVTRTAWSECALSDSDRVTIIQATQGG